MDTHLLKDYQQYLSGLGSFLHYYSGKELSWFFALMEREDAEKIRSFIRLFRDYGASDLLAQAAIVSYATQPNGLPWFVSQITEENALPAHLRSFLEKKIAKMERNGGYFLSSYAALMCDFWECIPQDPFSLPPEGSNAWLCLLLPGLYQNHLEETYLEKLNRFFFPVLRRHYQEQAETCSFDPAVRALMFYAIRTVSGELGWRYFTISDGLCNILLRSDMLAAQPVDVLLRGANAALAAGGSIALAIPPGWGENLAFLADAGIQQGLSKSFSVQCLNWYVPFALSLEGKDDTAAERFFRTVWMEPNLNMQSRFYGIFLLEYVRARQFAGARIQPLLRAVDTLSSEDSILLALQKFGSVANSICGFYQTYERNIYELRSHPSFDFDYYPPIFLSDEQFALFYSLLIENHAITKALSYCCRGIQDNTLPLEQRLRFVSSFYHCFCSLVSHLEQGAQGARIFLKDWLNEEQEKMANSICPCYELFDVYTPKEVIILSGLEQQLTAAKETLPDSHAFQLHHGIKTFFFRKEEAKLLSWERFSFLHEAASKRFEEMCRQLFLAEYAEENTISWSAPNHPGVEIAPVRSREDGKSISFQAKYFSVRVQFKDIRDSFENIAEIDRVYLYCNKKIDQNGNTFANISQQLSSRGTALIALCDEAIFDQLRKHPEIGCNYFYHEQN